MADTQVLGTCVFGRAGSSPASRTLFEFLTFRTYVSRHRGRFLGLGWGYVTSSSGGYGSHSGGSF